ncbi:elongation factor Tu, mitochondrial-like [Dioscorea cayenensis subsp. rotundata]|uniref:Elongation factor Tu, mitochondrial-like n=1 Tax=Dioscorea cayennensis subsp. rotundata TaxID=55577 RepID=A0AB40AIU6_DIOCR|nr:elongation factor Tu, mitochondrial-like [Dioscorea cayenensis subsp. rotundata]
MIAVDEYIPNPIRQLDKPFLMPIEDAGDNVGLLLRGLKRGDMQRGQVVCKDGSLKTYKKFEAEIYVLTKDEGCRHTAFFSNYQPQFYMQTADITGKVELPENMKMVIAGDNVTAMFELISAVPLEADDYFFTRMPHVRKRLTQGGVRLGATLNCIFLNGYSLLYHLLGDIL